MNSIYNFLVFLVSIILPLLARFNTKLKLFVKGRKESFLKIEQLKNCKFIWVHAASLGEFEQARPIIEGLKNNKPKFKILLTFFSPSGYEVQKNYSLADVVCYLPLDSKKNAKKILKIVRPKFVIFIKYEFWPNLLNQLYLNKIPAILVSGIFRKNQVFFKFYGGFMRKSLKAFHHFFLQNKQSKILLEEINYNNVTVAGDTRFDRVSKILNQVEKLDFIEQFKDNKYTLVAGSTWQEDEELLVNYINEKASNKEKIIIAPHNINKDAILKLKKSINKKTVLYSDRSNKNLAENQVFIIDTIGILTKIYASANCAYVGGGLKTGLHNILEPATFGIPVIVGNKYQKFKEAVDLVNLKGCISISNQLEINSIFTRLKEDKIFRERTGQINAKYVQEHLGATDIIINYLQKNI